MSSELERPSFDPIPVSAPSRSELPKIPEVPALASFHATAMAKPSPTPTTPTPAPAPASSPTPPAPAKGSFIDYLKPSRSKGIIVAGIASLVGGAATVRYLLPPPAPRAVVEKETPEQTPLPPAPKTEPTTLLPKIEASTLTPVVPATAPLLTETPKLENTAFPEVKLPDLTGVPVITSPPVISLTEPKKEKESAGVLPIPDLIPAGATETTVPAVKSAEKPAEKPPEKPFDMKLPDLTGTSTTPSTDVKLPSITAPTVGSVPAETKPAEAPAKVELPEVKLDFPKLNPTAPPAEAPKLDLPKEGKIEPLSITPVPVTGTKPDALKLPEVSVLPLPGVKPAIPAPEVKAETSPLPTLPAVSVTPTPTITPASVPTPAPAPTITPTPTLTPTPTITPTLAPVPSTTAPAPASATNTRTEYDVDLHYVKAGDSWATISKQSYGDERYAEAIRNYNQNASLGQLQRVELPPIAVLRKNFGSLISRNPERRDEWGSITPSSATATEPKRTITGGGYKVYVVPAGGRSLKEIAAAAYGDEGRWGMVWDTNPKLVPDKTIPEGTKIYLTSQSKIGD